MAVAMTESVSTPGVQSRGSLAYAWAAGLSLYCIAILIGNERAAMWVNDIAWTLASALAAVFCLRTARHLRTSSRRGWRMLGIACASWFIGQLYWNYSQLVLGVRVPFPDIGQLFYSLFAVFAIVAMLRLPESRQATPFTFKHVGNIGLVSCCLVVTVVLSMLEPALQIRVPQYYLWIGLIHTMLVAGTFLTTLYVLWTFRWRGAWTPMLLLVLATAIYSVANLVYAHALLTRSYLPGDLINVSWLIMFGLIAAAAREQLWLQNHPQGDPPQRMQSRERWLEAIVPALLMLIMVAVAIGSSATWTPRVIAWAAAFFGLFALILGAREAWIQNESQQLTDKLLAANEQLSAANVEAKLNEARYRELNTVLEQRVAERTAQLKSAYDELEGFSYAVAHDLKAPLRAINGFAHLLDTELDGNLNGRAREHLVRIRSGSMKMATLIDDLLSYSHIDRRGLRASTVSLPTLIDSILAQQADEIQSRGIAVSMQVEQLTLRLDVEGLSLALRNLLENALKYTREAAQPRIQIAAKRTDAGLLITLIDNGIGFDMQYHDHIFKVFQRLHREDRYPGTGIGLALVRKAIERMGGRVWANSATGEGATFYVELPGSVVV